ncbi:IpaD/SipD/SspD family type III secretion system needle tip protein [Erwiniaceae bacterium BAC15a-03b]|uniref:IpaD/SipD/SspD family type III secretion system needle tip protein n=1 Tax=Winslowiella arboricola TaxID=2978220 RepID=A0A9J6PH78_9GAMM|nr:IpaD/SipD/SspD family type III secretion system needle tip protein [Winslowiella arboricola]MCU5773755.1 IpaD/SipD/SspD family type III secretion system needle tip protein [Winslowiella arboricola]MCU5777665.1 IpaD/SipD/SspD family type III secretion system needle tip protein [Winslowiella arboricola]
MPTGIYPERIYVSVFATNPQQQLIKNDRLAEDEHLPAAVSESQTNLNIKSVVVKESILASKFTHFNLTLADRLASDSSYCLPISEEELIIKKKKVPGLEHIKTDTEELKARLEKAVTEGQLSRESAKKWLEEAKQEGITIKIVELDDLKSAAKSVAAKASAESAKTEMDRLKFYLTGLCFEELTTGTPNKSLEELHWEVIEQMKIHYMGVFLAAAEKMDAFFKAFNEIKASLSNFLSPGSKEGEVNFRNQAFMAQLDTLYHEFVKEKNSQLFPPANADGTYPDTTKEEAEKWIKQMGLSADCLWGGPTSYRVKIDLSPVVNMIGSLARLGSGSSVNLNSAQYGAWQAGFDSQTEQLQLAVRMLTQNTTHASSVFNQRVEILSRFYQQETETRMAILRALF